MPLVDYGPRLATGTFLILFGLVDWKFLFLAYADVVWCSNHRGKSRYLVLKCRILYEGGVWGHDVGATSSLSSHGTFCVFVGPSNFFLCPSVVCIGGLCKYMYSFIKQISTFLCW
jgi:hypothetical protein